jgi:peptide/nickel transport system ATP-binding protein
MTGAPALAVEDLSIAIGGLPMVDGVSFTVAAGEVMALVGESGCGKSLTAFALLGLLPEAARLTRGRIQLAGRDIAGLPDSALRRMRGRDMSIIFQEPTASLDPLSTVGSQVAEALRQHRGEDGARIDRAAARRAARDMLAEVGIADPERRLDQYPFELSGGMCQRVMIAIALIGQPRLLVADEPTTALDVTIQAQILDLMKRLVARRGTAIVLITHDMGVVADIADRVAVMYAGRVAEAGPVRAIFARPWHPYTALLLASTPRADVAPKARLATIDGTVPGAAAFGAGCRFAGRCPIATDLCTAQTPPLLEREPGHWSACWHPEQAATAGAAP